MLIVSLTQQAGLFSAILTAFLVQTYPMLQADGTNTTNQLLALSVSTQLRTAGTIISDTLNQTLTTLVDAVSTSFSPSTATRWINILFFLSLVFSLAAALFSILAKQWIREYLKWNSPLALPRENVLVRQIRIEAWEDWQVSTVLSSIPILLELGMILFLAGVILLLWTLDNIVAITITVFVSLFLAAFAAFTVIPILSRRCPYRSPTVWACCVALRFLVSPVHDLIRLIGQYGRNLTSAWAIWRGYRGYPFLARMKEVIELRTVWWSPLAKWPGRLQTWRDCDLQSCEVTKIRTGTWWPKTTDFHDAAGVELGREGTDLGEDGMIPEGLEPAGYYAAHLLLVNMAEVSYLIRALSWVHQSSQSTHVVTYIDQCMHQLHHDTPDEPEWTASIHMVTIWCVLSSLVKGHARSPHLALLHGSSGNQGDVTRLRRIFSRHTDFPISYIPSPLDHLLPTIMRLLAQPAIQHAADPSNVSPQSLRRRRELLGVLRSTASHSGEDRTWYVDNLKTIRHVYGSHDGAIRLMTFEQLLEYGKVTIGEDQKLCEAYATLSLLLECLLIINFSAFSQGFMGRDDYGSLLLHYFDNFDNAGDEDLNMFIVTSARYLRSPYPSSPIVSSILEKMISVAEITSRRQRCDTHRVYNAEDAAWISALYSASVTDKLLGEDYAGLFQRLLHIFERSYARGVLVGDQNDIRLRLHECLETAHKARTCEVADCRWISHSCHIYDCTLLRDMTAATAPHSENEDINPFPSPDATHATSLDPARTTHEPSHVHTHLERPAPHSPTTHIDADASADGPSVSHQTDSSRYGQSPAILTGRQLSDPEAIRRRSNGSSVLSLRNAIVGATSVGDIAGGVTQVYTALPGTTDTLESRESAALEDPTGGSLKAGSLKDRDEERSSAQGPEDHCAPSQAYTVDGSTNSASVRTSTVGALGPSNANTMPGLGMDAVTSHYAQHDMPQDSPSRPVVAAEGPPREESAADSSRLKEESPIRAAAILFQGEVGVSASGGEMFELTIRDEGAGEGGSEGVGDGLVEAGS